MPSQVMHQRRLPSSYAPFMYSFCSEEIRHPLQKQVGFWRSELPPDNVGSGTMPLVSGKTIAPTVEKFHSVSTSSPQNLEPFQSCQLLKEPNSKTYSTQLKETDGKAASPITSRKTLEHSLVTPYGAVGKPLSLNNKINLNELPLENGQFSRSLPGIVKDKFTDGALFNQSTNKVYSNIKVDDTVESLKEIEDKAIGDLLPDDDELFSGVIDEIELEHVLQTKTGNDVDDDLFCSGGGIELEVNGVPRLVDLNGQFCRGYDHGEYPSRTLIVRNVNSGLEDAVLRFIFEHYGDIHTFNTSFKDHGLVMISYYNLRSACDAIRGLQGKLLMQRKLDVQFSVPGGYPSENDINQGTIVVSNLDSSVSNDYLRQLFGVYGEIKEIQEYTQKHQQLIEFYDIRAAESAIHALNRSIIAGKEIQLEPHRGHVKGSLVQQMPHKFGSDKKESPPNSSPSIFHGGIPFGERASSNFVNVKGASVDGHPNGDDLNRKMGQLGFDFPCIPTLHPHSMPEYHDDLVNNISSMTSSVGLNFLGHTEAVDNRHIPGIILGEVNSQAFVHNEESFGVSGSDSCLHEGHRYTWSNCPSNQCPPGPFPWPHSSSRVSSIHSHSHSQVIGLPMPPNVLNTVQTSHHHHVGSAPTGNPLLWDNCHAYKEDFTDTTAFHLCSLGNARFHGSPAMHPLGFGSVNMIPQVGRSRMETSISPPQLPSQRNFHTVRCGQNPIPMPVALESPVDRFKSRKSDPSSNQADNKKQYELDIERIVRGEDSRTTLMIKNIPNKYTSKMLLATIDEHHRGTYDFIYLPIDFKNKCNVGYAFINLIDSKHIIPFYKAFNGKKWEKFNSEKVASLAYARIQGKAALVSHFQNSSLMNEDKRCRPILFRSDGPNAGDQEPFPIGMNIRSRSGRHTTKNDEESHHGSPSNSESGDEFSNGSNSTTGSTDS